MTTILSNLRIIALIAIAITIATRPAVAELSESDKEFLANYENVRAALAADDLGSAKKAAAPLAEEGAALANSDKIEAARAAFTKLSEHAIQAAKGQSGYYVVNCPMLRKDWVQTSAEISNPYAGKSMLTCGVVRK